MFVKAGKTFVDVNVVDWTEVPQKIRVRIKDLIRYFRERSTVAEWLPDPGWNHRRLEADRQSGSRDPGLLQGRQC